MLYILLQPSLRSSFHSFLRPQSLEHLISESKNNGHIPAQLFWEVRERYAPGTIVFEREGIDKGTILENPIRSDLISITQEHYLFLTFESQEWKSYEMLTDLNDLTSMSASLTPLCQTVIFQTDTDLICLTPQKEVLTAFIKSIEEMKQANGFFDYNKHDTQLLENKNWLVLSVITK